MSKWLLVALLLALPAAGIGVSALLGWSVEREWRSGQGRIPDAAARPARSMARACAEPRVAAAAADACSMSAYDDLLRLVGIPAGPLGLVWLGIVEGAAFAARRSRTSCARLFTPGLLATQAVAAALILATAIVAIAPVPLLMMTFGGRASVKIALVLGLVALTALGGLAALVKVTPGRRRAALVVGRAVAEQDAPALWRVVRDVSRRAGASPPDHLVLGLEPNFFVTEAPVRCVDGSLTGRTMFVSLPLCRILRLDEVRSILGHELAHFAGLDTEVGGSPPASAALHGLASAAGGGAASFALLPGASLLACFLDAFAGAERDLRRERELLADRGGARASSAAAMAAALVKVHTFSDAWTATRCAMGDGLREGKVCENASLLFADLAAATASPGRLAGLDERRLAHPTDSHPPLSVRLENLGTSLSEVAGRALDVAPRDPAIAVVEACDRIERELSEVEQVLLAHRLGLARGPHPGSS